MRKNYQNNFSRFLRKCTLVTASSFLLASVAGAQTIMTIAGTGTAGNTGDGGQATAATIHEPWSVAVDAAGNVYITDTYNMRVRKISPTGIISDFAGPGVFGTSGDGGPATAGSMVGPYGIAVDPSGNVFISDYSLNEIRKVTPAGIISHFVGGPLACYTGDGGPASVAQVDHPWGIAADNAGNVYIADYSNSAVRKVDAVTGIITTIAGGDFIAGFSGDGGPATAAQLLNPTGVAVDAAGNVYIADCANFRIRKVNTAGIISTIAGGSTPGSLGDGGPATAGQLEYPRDVALDAAGNIYIADEMGSKVRMVNTAGILSTFAGTSWGYTGDGGAATASKLGYPSGIAIDPAGNVYIADNGTNTIRKINQHVTTSVQQVTKTDGFNVYPNPSSGLFTVAIPGNTENAEVFVTDMTGKIVEHKKLNPGNSIKAQIDLTNLPIGTYLLKVKADGKNYSGKILMCGE